MYATVESQALTPLHPLLEAVVVAAADVVVVVVVPTALVVVVPAADVVVVPAADVVIVPRGKAEPRTVVIQDETALGYCQPMIPAPCVIRFIQGVNRAGDEVKHTQPSDVACAIQVARVAEST